MKLLILGGAGFIGSNFIRYIRNKYPEYKIFNIDKLSYAGNIDNLKGIKISQRYNFAKIDICNYEKLEKVIKKFLPDCIVNFAAETHVDRSILNPRAFIETDVFGTFNVLELVKKYNVPKFTHISTDEVYGSIDKGSFYEKDKLNPSSPYSASKSAADLLCGAYYKTYKVPVSIIRPTNNYGPYQYPEKFIPLMITNAIENLPLPIYGEGKNVRNWLFVFDTAEAIDIVIHKGKDNEIYNVSSKDELQNIDVIKKILKLVNKPESLIRFVKDRPGHDFRYSINCEKIAQLGFKPKYDFDKGLKITVEWYKTHTWWWKKIKSGKDFVKYYKKQYQL